MMDDRVKKWLSTVASQLNLPRKQKAVVLEELQGHVQADLADRMQAGLSEDEVVSATLAEMGDPAEAAKGLNRVHSGGSGELRKLLGLQIMFLGFIGSIAAKEWLVRTALEQRVGPDGGFWPDQILMSLRWMSAHKLDDLALLPLLLAGVSVIIGYVTGKSAWKYTFLPVVIFYGAITLLAITATVATGGKVGVDLRLDVRFMVLHYGMLALALLGGAHLGDQLARLDNPPRRRLLALFAAVAGLAPCLGWAWTIVSISSLPPGSQLTLGGLLLIIPLVSPGLLALVVLARRRWRRAVTSE
ncbi:MAG: hypothetical protein JXA57_08175 [Armatimonadetes bacterium]|nr:hypothetical protein [Armatimonadota bacterium]